MYNYEHINDNSSQHRSAIYWAGDTLDFTIDVFISTAFLQTKEKQTHF